MVTGLPAAIERLRSGASSLTVEASTLSITYNELRSALKEALGADGYTTLMEANHAAKQGAKPARAPREPRTDSVTRPRPDDTGLPLVMSMKKSEGWTWRHVGEHESRPVTVTVNEGTKNQEKYGFNDCGERYLIMISPEGTEFVRAFDHEPATLLRAPTMSPSDSPLRFVEWEMSELKKQVDKDTRLGDEELKARSAALEQKKAKSKGEAPPPTITEAAAVKKRRAVHPQTSDGARLKHGPNPAALKSTKATKRRSTK